MSNILRRATLSALAVAAALACAGCADKREEAEGQAAFAEARPVSAAQRALAEQQVRKLWSDPQVAAKVSQYDPPAGYVDFYRDLVVLTRHPHRLAGYGQPTTVRHGEEQIQRFEDAPGSLFAGQYVADRLKAMGVELVITQDFPIPQPITTECKLVVDGQVYEQGFYAMRTNHLQAPCTPAGGLKAEKVVYAGDGSFDQYRDNPRDAVVVLDFAAADRWTNAFALGAKAVIFVGSDAPAPNTHHHLNIPANLPRFYVTRELADKAGLTALKQAPTRSRSCAVEIHAATKWQLREGRNVVGIIRGANPKFPRDANDTRAKTEALLVAVPLDSLSEVPLLSPGARQAANCAAALQLAASFQKDRPRRDVIFCFVDGDARNHAGARALYGDLYRHKDRGKRAKSLADRLWMLQGEQERIRAVQEILATGNIFSDHAKDLPHHTVAVLGMQNEAKGMYGAARDDLQFLRTGQLKRIKQFEALGGEKDDLLKKVNEDRKEKGEEPLEVGPTVPGEDPIATELRSQIDRIDRDEVAPREHELIVWSDLRRALQNKKYPDPANVTGKKQKESVAKVAEKYRLVSKALAELNSRRLTVLDRKIEHTRQGHALVEAMGENRDQIVLHLVLNLGDDSDRWAFIQGQDSHVVHITRDSEGRYAKMFQAIREVAEDVRKSAPEALSGFEGRTIDGLHNIRMFAPGLFAHSGAVAGTFGVPNLSLMTPMDRRVRDGQPCDVLTRAGKDGPVRVLRTERMVGAYVGVEPFLRAMADVENMSLRSDVSSQVQYTPVEYERGGAEGPSAMMLSGASPIADRPARGGFAAVMRAYGNTWEEARVDLVPPGFEPFSVTDIDAIGRFEPPPLSRIHYMDVTMVACLFDERGLIKYINNADSVKFRMPLHYRECVLFNAKSMALVGTGFDRGVTTTGVLRAASTAPLISRYSLTCESGNILSVYCKRTTEKLKVFNPDGIAILGNSPDNPIVGDGIDIDPYAHPPTAQLAAADLQTLNAGRLKILSDNRILEPTLQQLHVDGRDALERGKSLPPERLRRAGTQAGSAAISRQPYRALLDVFNDLVVAVVLLLLLSIPFAYSIERLLIGTPHIYRQIGWFTLFFLATFGVLFFVNPAFRIAATPIVIFLAFAIILLSAIVIVIMTRKLQAEVRRMQGISSTVHSSDVSRLGTMMAAVSMGISTMRRRPVRTILTAVTVVLLTFTILTFASFSSSWGNRRTSIGPMSGTPRLLVRHPFWTRMPEDIQDMLAGFLADEAVVVPRYWVAQTAQDVKAYKAANRVKKFLLGDAEGKRIAPVSALLGLDPRDLEHAPELAELLGENARQGLAGDGVFLTSALAGGSGLNVAVGDTVWVDGVRCTFAGIIDRYKVTRHKLLEGSNMLPVDYEASSGGGEIRGAEPTAIQDLPEMESAQFEHFSPDHTAIISARLARRLGGRVASITIYPTDQANLERIGQRVATMTGLPTYVGSGGGVTRLFFTSLTSASGWRDLIVPVILGGLIIFATMLGSVSDREKEIYAFSALGLAPPHVAGLFFAEAAVYAFVGGMGGYLLGQVVARGLSFVSHTFGILSVPTMNYSSTNAIATVLLVMFTVMVSTIYPAIKASRSANPGIQRSWRMGKPIQPDLYDIVFPFTVSAYDITGVVGFLNEHFQNYTDSTLGVFATTSSSVFRSDDGNLGVRADVALAPFDLGVAQRFAMVAQPSEIEGIEEIRVLLRRIAGTRGDWQRANRVFIHELRKQLLIWRSLAAEVMEGYRQRTLQDFKNLPVMDIRPENFGENE